MRRVIAVAAIGLFLPACFIGGTRVVKGGKINKEGWPARPSEQTLRCPDGTDLVDEIALSGRRMVTCRSMSNPLSRRFELIWNQEGDLVSHMKLTDDGVPLFRVQWFDDGEKSSEERYEDGQLVRRIAWYENGEKRTDIDEGEEDGVLIVKRWQADGTIEAMGKKQDGMKVGEWTEWRDGAVETLTYVEDVRHGPVTRDYPTGGSETGEYRGGRKDGTWVRVDEIGRKLRSVEWKDGVRDGAYKVFHPSTQLRESGHYNNGNKHGKWQTWYPSGELQSEAWFECGLPVGPLTTYYRDGKPRKTGAYEDGRQVGEWKTYNDFGVAAQLSSYPAPAEPWDPENLKEECERTEEGEEVRAPRPRSVPGDVLPETSSGE